MKNKPMIVHFPDGSKGYEQDFELFHAAVYIPTTEIPVDMVNYGFVAPYLIVLMDKEYSVEEAKHASEANKLAEIASAFGGSVLYVFPKNGDWNKCDVSLYQAIMEESRIGQYYEDGIVKTRDRFTGNWGDIYMRGSVSRAFLFGFKDSADYIAKNCLNHVDGFGVFGPGDITPAAVMLCGVSASAIPETIANDMAIASISNSKEIDEKLRSSVKYFYTDNGEGIRDYKELYEAFMGQFRRMMGNLDTPADVSKMGVEVVPDYCTVPTAADNRGDDKDTKEHKIGYLAFLDKETKESGKKVPLVLCFHGGGDSTWYMSTISGWNVVAAKYKFLLVCIENHLNSTATEMMSLIEHLKTKYNIDTTKIYSTGFSMGGCKSWDMYQEYPTVFAAVAPMDATFEVRCNSYGNEVNPCNEDICVPVFYAGGEITPLPELPFQAQKCTDRMGYVLRINKAKKPYDVDFKAQDTWANPIWGIDGDEIIKLHDDVRNSDLTMHLFESKDGNCYSIFASISGQGHEVRFHTCENAWKFMSLFSRNEDGSLTAASMETVMAQYK